MVSEAEKKAAIAGQKALGRWLVGMMIILFLAVVFLPWDWLVDLSIWRNSLR
jgi:hypothetical protein